VTNTVLSNDLGVKLSVLLVALTLLHPVVGLTQVNTAQPKAADLRSPAYPLKVSANHRYLVDQNNVPFLIVGDSPQGLLSRLTEEEADSYFADRRRTDSTPWGG
jgi:hypothetical protein